METTLPASRQPMALDVIEPPRQWPSEVDFILSAMEAASGPPWMMSPEPRQQTRTPWRSIALLRLFTDLDGAPPWTLYTRDASPTGLGFLTRHRMPLGYRAMLTVRNPQGQAISVECTLHRCRETLFGWFEGSVQFSHTQPDFKMD